MRRSDLALHLTAAAVALVALGPALGSGYVLAYDMVFTPHLPLSWDALGLGPGLPRAVPQDAIVGVLSVLVRGDLLQKVALFAAFQLAVVGAARLVPAGTAPAVPAGAAPAVPAGTAPTAPDEPGAVTAVRLVAGVAYGWNAFVAERLLIGHWSLLLAYAALPWIARAGLDARRGGAFAPVIGWSALAALTPTGGVLALATTVAVLAGRGERAGRRALAIGAVALLNAPWVMAGALATGGGRSDPAGVGAFAARSENWSGVVGSVLGLGGIWNVHAMPASRASVVAPLLTLLVAAVAVLGWGPLRTRLAGAPALLALAAGGVVLALAGAVPGGRDLLGVIVAGVPGGGILRDGQKWLAPFALVIALGFALGAQRLASLLDRRVASAVLLMAALVPVVAVPDLAWGGWGRLRSAEYPGDWGAVAAYLRDHGRGTRDELVPLPMSTFRAYGFNRGRTSLDPTPRYLPVRVVADDRLVVDGTVLAGESERVAELLAGVDRLQDTGVRWVLVQRGTPGEVAPSSLTGMRQVYAGAELELYENPRARLAPAPSRTHRAALTIAYAVAALVLVLTCGTRLRARWARRSGRRDRAGRAA